MPITKDNTSYQYIKFNDGKEIFAMVREIDDKLELNLPMHIMCRPAITGGVTIHLGPFVPFTTVEKMIIDTSDVVVRTSITNQFISLYDEACTTWLDMRENDKLDIKTSKEDYRQQQKELASLVKENLSKIAREELWEDYPEDEEYYNFENLPGKDDIIH